MKQQPINPSTPITELLPERFLKVSMLINWKTQRITATISEITLEEVYEPGSGQTTMKPVIYLTGKDGRTFSSGYLLTNQADRAALMNATGASTVGEAIGKPITIMIDSYRGRKVLRIADKTDQPKKPTTE